MTRRIVYSNGSIRVAISNMKVFDKVTPFWVYYNDKLVTKFANKETAKSYAMVLFNG
jgi:hypothetical protein